MEKIYRVLSGVFLLLLTIAFGTLTLIVSRAAAAKAPMSPSLIIDVMYTIDIVLLLYGICSLLIGLLKRKQLSLHDSFPQWYKQSEIRRGILDEFVGLIGLIILLAFSHSR